jgi:hypothetical protein
MNLSPALSRQAARAAQRLGRADRARVMRAASAARDDADFLARVGALLGLGGGAP